MKVKHLVSFGMILLLIGDVFSQNLSKSNKYLQKGDKYQFSKGEIEKSLSLYEKAVIVSDSLNIDALNSCGVVNRSLGNYELALKFYNKLLELEPKNSIVYSNRGNVYADLLEFEKALSDLSYSIYLDDTYAAAYNNRGRVKSINFYYEEAIADFTKAIARDNTDFLYYNNRGVAYKKNLNFIEAQSDFERAVELAPQNGLVYYNMALLQIEVYQMYDEAQVNLEKALDLGFFSPDCYFKLGYIHQQRNEHIKAVDFYTQTISLENSMFEPYYNRGTERAKLKQYALAKEDYSQALKLNPECHGVYTNRALLVHMELGDYKEAIQDLTSELVYIESNGGNIAFTFNNLGYAHHLNANDSLAHYYVRKSIMLDPLNSYAYKNLALILLSQDKKDEACLAASQSIELGFIPLYGDEILDIQKTVCSEDK